MALINRGCVVRVCLDCLSDIPGYAGLNLSCVVVNPEQSYLCVHALVFSGFYLAVLFFTGLTS
jgi:hypothetical protein